MILDLAVSSKPSGRIGPRSKKRWTGWPAIPIAKCPSQDLERFHAMYQRTSADLAKVATLHSESELRRYLEWLVSRAYSEIHETRERRKFRPWRWFTIEFPRAFRRHLQALSAGRSADGDGLRRSERSPCASTPKRKYVIMPFNGLRITPAERVAREQQTEGHAAYRARRADSPPS